MSKNITNKELEKKFQKELSEGKVVCFHTEESTNGHKSIFLVQKVNIKSNIGTGSSLSLVAFVGATAGTRLVRAIVTVPTNYPIEANKSYNNIAIKLERNTSPFRDEASKTGKYPSQAVLNPNNGLITMRDGMPVYEHITVITTEAGKNTPEWDLSVDGETGTCTPEEVKELLLAEGISEERAERAAQTEFEVQEVEKMQQA